MSKQTTLVCSLIVLACLLIYFSNETSITSTDDVPTGLLGFNWLENHQLNFDFFRDTATYSNKDSDFSGLQNAYYFIETANGHVSAKYPIGPSILSFPLYAVFFISTKLSDLIQTLISGNPTDSLDLASREFLTSQRTHYETIAATCLSALSAVLFYLASRLKFGAPTALLSTFIFCFSTSMWVVCSQGLRQHTVSNLIVLATMLALFKANRTVDAPQKLLLVLAGFFSGLLHSSRPTSLLFFLAFIVYCIYTYRKNCLYFFVGTSSILMGIAWNVYYFGLSNFLKGGYAQLTSGAQTYSLQYFPESAIGLLFSPSRGWLVLCPILLFAIPGIRKLFQWPLHPDEQLLACLSMACLALYVHYWFYFSWSGVLVYGPSRFLIDVLPIVCFSINYYLHHHFHQLKSGAKKLWSSSFIAFFACLVFSTSVQAIGAFGNNSWATIPTPHGERLWSIQDSLLERTTRGILFDIRDPISNSKSYLDSSTYRLLEFTDRNGTLVREGAEVQAKRNLRLKLKLENTGTSTWYGYESGTKSGILQATVQFTTPDGEEVGRHRKHRIYVEGHEIQPGETAIAVGEVKFPAEPGPYIMTVSLEVAGIGRLSSQEDQSTRIQVRSRRAMQRKYGETPTGFKFE
ncbi:MAG: hypothetical protein AAFU78_13790 [Cyanobacteria bacterium J06633_2]